MNKLKKMGVILIVFILLFTINSIKILATTFELSTTYSEQYLEWLNQEEELKKERIMPPPSVIEYKEKTVAQQKVLLSDRLLKAAGSYSLKNNIQIEVKNQGLTNECWAFSANSVLETNLALRNNEKLNFSERYLDYATTRTFLNGQINTKGFKRELGDGGNMYISLPFYVSGQGPILESQMPFENNENKIGLSAIENKNIVKKIESYTMFPNILKTRAGNKITYTNGAGSIYTQLQMNDVRNAIKEHIIKYGAVSSVTYAKDLSNYTSDYVSYYYDGTKSYDHQITIIGWDDNYAVTNFSADKRPVNPGAYLVLNSYGENFGNTGYYYISYDDAYIEFSAFGVKDIVNVDYNSIYQYDEYGMTQAISAGSAKTIYGANVFSRNSNKKEKLQEVGLYSFANLNCEIYVNPNNETLSLSNLVKVTSSIKTLEPGYQTITLDSPIELKGDKFSIVVKYIGLSAATVGAETKLAGNPIYEYVSSNKGESLVSVDMVTWSDINDIPGIDKGNLCIKGFTKEFVEEKDPNKITILDTYGLDSVSNYIFKIPRKTTVNNLLSKVKSDGTIAIVNTANQAITGSSLVGTGMKLKVNNSKTYTLVVIGDLSGDGEVSILDLSKLKSYIIGRAGHELVGEYFRAANLSYDRDDEVTVLDLSKMKRIVIGLDD